MAELSAEQQLLIDLVGDVDPITGDTPLTPADGVVRSNFDTIWARHSDKPVATRDLYVIRDACDLWLGVVAPEVSQSGSGGMSIQLQQRFDHFQQRRKDAHDEIVRIETQSQSSRAPVSGLLSVIEPISPPWTPFGPNANDPRYVGSPYITRRWR